MLDSHVEKIYVNFSANGLRSYKIQDTIMLDVSQELIDGGVRRFRRESVVNTPYI